MAKKVKVFGIFNIIDTIILLVAIIGLIALIVANLSRYSPIPQATENMKNVEIDVLLKWEKQSNAREIFNAGDETFITIRNVPYTKLEILKTVRTPAMIAIPDPSNKRKAIAVEDPSAPYSYNYLVTVADSASITRDGVVIGGNKIKIGLPITLEGFDYKLSGVVTDVRINEEQEEKQES